MSSFQTEEHTERSTGSCANLKGHCRAITLEERLQRLPQKQPAPASAHRLRQGDETALRPARHRPPLARRRLPSAPPTPRPLTRGHHPLSSPRGGPHSPRTAIGPAMAARRLPRRPPTPTADGSFRSGPFRSVPGRSVPGRAARHAGSAGPRPPASAPRAHGGALQRGRQLQLPRGRGAPPLPADTGGRRCRYRGRGNGRRMWVRVGPPGACAKRGGRLSGGTRCGGWFRWWRRDTRGPWPWWPRGVRRAALPGAVTVPRFPLALQRPPALGTGRPGCRAGT